MTTPSCEQPECTTVPPSGFRQCYQHMDEATRAAWARGRDQRNASYISLSAPPKVSAGKVVAAVAVLVVVVAVIVGAVSGSSLGGGNSVSHPSEAGYDGWTVPLAKTTCVQWDDDMLPQQQLAMSEDLIVRLDAKDQSQAYAASFARDVSRACSPRVDTVADISAAIATIAKGDFN